MDLRELKYRAKEYYQLTRSWYLNLDKKKKVILWLYVGCGIVLLVGSISIIISSVFQSEKFDNKAKLDAYLEKTEALNEKYEEVSEENNLEALEDRTKIIEIDFEDASKNLESNKEIIENLLNPISAPISD